MKIFAIVSGVFVVIVITLLALAPGIAESLAFRSFPPAEREKMHAQYKKWRTVPVVLPAAAMNPKPYGAEIVAAARLFETEWEKKKEAASKLIEEQEDQKPNTAGTADLAPFAPLLDAYTAIVRSPGYSISAFASHTLHDDGRPPTPNFLSIQKSAKLLRIRALTTAREGKIDAALADAESIVRAARTGPYDELIAQLIGVAICSIGSTVWGEAVRPCEDPALLKRTLAAQNALAPELVYLGTDDVPVEVVDYLGMIREMQRRGVAVKTENLTGRQLSAKAWEAQADYLETKVLPTVLNDAKLETTVRAQVNSFRKISAATGGPAKGLFGMVMSYGGRISAPTLYGIALPNFEEARARANLALSRFDLLRLETARKLYSLEKGQSPAANEALIPGYLPQLPIDRFAQEAKQPLRLSGGKPYSIGPDARDDALALAYDPSNGTISAGDIALP